jgi:zinc transport system substrate-binding protein
MVKKIALTVLILLVIGIGIYALRGRLPTTHTGNDARVSVATSFYPMYYFATEIGGDKADIFNITPAGAEPHDYEPTVQEIASISDSDLLIINGGNLETWANRLQSQLQNTHVVVAGEMLATKDLDEDGRVVRDPHVWLDPVLAKVEVKNIAEGFIEIDPMRETEYKTNAASLENKLDALDQKFKDTLRTCKTRDFVTSHAAFGYLAGRYNLHQISIAGVSPNEEPGAAKLAEIANLVKDKGIKYIFFESLISPKLAETIARETGAQTLVLDPIEGLSADDLAAGKNYMTQMEMNLTNLKLALACTN